MSKYIIIIKSLFDYSMKDKKINNKNYTYRFIKLLLNDYYFDFIKCLDNDYLNICIKENDEIEIIKIDTIENIIDIMNYMIRTNYFNYIEKNKILNIILMNKIKKYFNAVNYYIKFNFKNDKNIYSMNNLIDLFLLNPKNFKEYIYKYCNKKNNIDLLKKFAFFLNSKDYIKNINIRKNIVYIISISNELEINEVSIKKKNQYINRIKLDDEFVIRIIKDIPNTFSDLEKAIFIYIKLCNILTHDVNDIYRNSYNINHKNIHRLKKINEKNNIIVCYEFVYIFAKILDIFKIKCEIGGDQVYGRGHTYLKMFYKNSIIGFDSTRGLIDCDLAKVKNNIRVCGINPIKADNNVMNEIYDSIDNVYEYLLKKLNHHYYYETEYIKLGNNNNKLEFNDKIKMFLNEIINTNLSEVDNIKRINILKKQYFSHDSNVNIAIIENKMYKYKSVLSIIFTFNNNDNLEHYIYLYPNKISKIPNDFIQNNFISGKFKYIKFLNSSIPGIIVQSKDENPKIKRLSEK